MQPKTVDSDAIVMCIGERNFLSVCFCVWGHISDKRPDNWGWLVKLCSLLRKPDFWVSTGELRSGSSEHYGQFKVQSGSGEVIVGVTACLQEMKVKLGTVMTNEEGKLCVCGGVCACR